MLRISWLTFGFPKFSAHLLTNRSCLKNGDHFKFKILLYNCYWLLYAKYGCHQNNNLVPIRSPWTVKLPWLLEIILLSNGSLQINKVKLTWFAFLMSMLKMRIIFKKKKMKEENIIWKIAPPSRACRWAYG